MGEPLERVADQGCGFFLFLSGGRFPRASPSPAGAAVVELADLGGSAVLGFGEERDPDSGERHRDEELDDRSDVEKVGEDAAEKARGDSDQPRCEQADVLSAREDEPPQRPDDETGEHEPDEREGQADERARQQQDEDDDEQDDDDRHGADASERRRAADVRQSQS